ncbi:MAG: orotate phosphoribosyltransferase [Dehalococcoidia bacterium]|nr:MAG: orotate phosphoribosyltransferase [Dehalococcoidia bacterium]
MTGAERQRLRELIDQRAIARGDFLLSSGKRSSYYIDLRLLSLSPEGAYLLGRAALDLAEEAGATAIGGPVAAVVPIIGAAVALSYQQGRPLRGFMVRKETKAHGTGRQIEGPLEPGMRVAVLDDTTTTGASLEAALAAVEAFGCPVVLVGTIVDREEGARERFLAAGYPYRAVFSIREFGLTPV